MQELQLLKLILATLDYSTSLKFELNRIQINMAHLSKAVGANDLSQIIESERLEFDKGINAKYLEVVAQLDELLDAAKSSIESGSG